MNTKRCFVFMASVLASIAAFCATSIPVGENETYTLDSATNPTGWGAYGDGANDSILVVGGNATLSVSPTASGSTYIIYKSVIVTNGTLTVSFAKGISYQAVQFANGLRLANSGKIHFADESVKVVYVGRDSLPDRNVNWPTCDVAGGNLTFAAKDATGLVLREYVTLRNAPTGWVPDETHVLSESHVALQGANPLAFGSENTLSHFDILVLTQASIPAGCTVNVPVGREFGFRPASANLWKWAAASVSTTKCRVNLLGKGAKLFFREASGYSVRTEADVYGTGEVEFRTEWASFRSFFRGVSVVSPSTAGKKLVLAVDESKTQEYLDSLNRSWTNKVSHWFDASDSRTVHKFAYKPTKAGWENVKNQYDGHDIVIGWTDKIKGQSDKYFFNNRILSITQPEIAGDGYVLQVMPYLVENDASCPNGLPYLCFGSQGGSRSGAKYDTAGKPATANEARRLRVSSGAAIDVTGARVQKATETDFGITPECIMVFGSQQGGGKAILDSQNKAGQGNLARAGTTVNNNWANYKGFMFWVDGDYLADYTTEHPNGGWQVVSLDMKGTNTVIQGIGSHQLLTQGGQNYAELIFFNEALGSDERFACEWYLAKKWGLTSQFVRKSIPILTLTEANGGTVELYDSNRSAVDRGQAVVLDGTFSGSITVPNGRTLVVTKPLPPDEADVPTNALVGWYDPNYAEALEMMTETPGAEGGVDRLYGRTADGVVKEDGKCFMSATHTPGQALGRYPFLVAETRPAEAPVRGWMDFTKNGASDKQGNTLRFHDKLSARSDDLSVSSVSVRQGFIVADTSLGGGNPIGSSVGFDDGAIKPRDGWDVNSPIWNADNGTKMATTWLDTRVVDPAKGFSGRPEVLSFASEDDLAVGVFGYYKGLVGGLEGNSEILGEILLYAEELPDDDRTLVQEYLMAKWFGDYSGKYANFSGTTVSGSGSVKVADLGTLPKFASTFSGKVLVTGTCHTFDLTGEAKWVPAQLAIPDGSEIQVKAIGMTKIGVGQYVLLRAKGLTVDCSKLTLSVETRKIGRKLYEFAVEDNALVLNILSNGLILQLK